MRWLVQLISLWSELSLLKWCIFLNIEVRILHHGFKMSLSQSTISMKFDAACQYFDVIIVYVLREINCINAQVSKVMLLLASGRNKVRICAGSSFTEVQLQNCYLVQHKCHLGRLPPTKVLDHCLGTPVTALTSTKELLVWRRQQLAIWPLKSTSCS